MVHRHDQPQRGVRCMRRLQRILADGLAVLAIALIVPPALDQAARAQGNGVAEIAAYEGADRERRLIEGAKKEKELTFYSSIPTTTFPPWSQPSTSDTASRSRSGAPIRRASCSG